MVENLINEDLKELDLNVENLFKIAIKVNSKENLYLTDLFLLSIFNRSISLLEGFKTLIKQKNYLCATPLVRMQLENILKIQALNLVSDRNDAINKFLSGERMDNLKSAIDNRKLTDKYIVDFLKSSNNWIEEVYNQSCQFVHLSDKHFFITIQKDIKNDNTYKFKIGGDDIFVPLETYLETIRTMDGITKSLILTLKNYSEI